MVLLAAAAIGADAVYRVGWAKAALRAARRKPWWENSIWIWVFQGLVAGAVMLMLGYITLWMDNHNDVRYVPKVDYKRDVDNSTDRFKDYRESAKSDRDAIRSSAIQDKQDLGKILDRQQMQLDTISNDIKSLLRQK